MRVVMLSWEYPPRIIGGISRHVEELSGALASRGHEIHVISCSHPDAPPEEEICGVHVHRVDPICHAGDLIHWVHLLNGSMHERADRLIRGWIRPGEELPRRTEQETIILHAHDWLAHFSTRELKHEFKLPVIATIHGTEYGRNQGIHTEMQRSIASTEWQLTYEAWRVIACSDFMEREIREIFTLPSDKIDVIPNGVRTDKFDFDFSPEEARRFRSELAADDEKLIFFVGRMVPEKGVDLLVDALPKIRMRVPEARLVVVGGGNIDPLKELAERLGVAAHITFTGFVPDEYLLRLYRVVDVACYPSRYEPFGIVALEAMAAGVPVVVSSVGGLAEVVEQDVTGTVFPAEDSGALADAVIGVLRDLTRARRLAESAGRRVRESYTWDRVATLTSAVYERVQAEYAQVEW